MKHIFTLLLVLLFVSCEQMGTNEELIEDDPNVFVFEGNFSSAGSELENENISFSYHSKLTFTISDEDNCTYYIYEEEFDLKGYEGSYVKKPYVTDVVLVDEIGNEIFSFNPVKHTPIIRGKKLTHKGKVLKYYDKSSNLTRSKLERTNAHNLNIQWTLRIIEKAEDNSSF
jgi:hypothetical protein